MRPSVDGAAVPVRCGRGARGRHRRRSSAAPALAELIYTPLPQAPKWDLEAMRASRRVFLRAARLSDKPMFKADPLNLFVVVELGDHHVTILDGDKLEPLGRFPTRFALHLYNLKYVAEIRAGINTRNLAVSGDGKYVMVANCLPHTLVVLDAGDLTPFKVIAVKDDEGKTSRVSAVYDAATLEEIKRLPMKKPSGKYNVYNETTRSEGTSH